MWSITPVTVPNVVKMRQALMLLLGGQYRLPFTKSEQSAYNDRLLEANIIDSEQTADDDGGRKFAMALMCLGFVTDWSRGKTWQVTPIGENLIRYPNIESVFFLRQLLKYQIPSPLENTQGFRVRPFRLMLRFLKQAHDEGLVGLTKYEIGLFAQMTLTEKTADFEAAFAGIRAFRVGYDAQPDKVAMNRYAAQELQRLARQVGSESETLLDYADRTAGYSMRSGVLNLRGNKLNLAPSRLPFIEQLLFDGSTPLSDADYLTRFYDPESPPLPTRYAGFLRDEIV